MTSVTMTVRLDDQLKLRLDKLATVTHRSKSFLAAEAISQYVEVQEWQLAEIKAALLEADAEQLTDQGTVASRWGEKHAHSMDKGR